MGETTTVVETHDKPSLPGVRLMKVLCTTICAMLLLAASVSAEQRPTSVYDAIPTPLPPDVESLGFEATQTSEFGDHIHLKGRGRRVQSITVTLSDWASYADYKTDPRYAGNHRTWMHPITLNVYKAKALDQYGAPTERLLSITRYVEIPWRPAVWNCSGIAFNVKFNIDAELPSDVIIGVAFDTEHYGGSPIGTPGPYNSLNVGVPEGQTAVVGEDDDADAVFWNTDGDWYADGGVGGHFREDTIWTPYGTVALRVVATGNRDDDDRDEEHDQEHGHGRDHHHRDDDGRGRNIFERNQRDDRDGRR